MDLSAQGGFLMSDNAGAKFSYFLVGLGIGAMIGILFAPRSGKETRADLAERMEQGRESLLRKSRELREQAEEYVERAKDLARKQKDQITSAIEAGKQAYREEKSKTS